MVLRACTRDWIQRSTANVLRNGSFVRLLHWNYIKCLNVCFALIRLSPLLSLSFTVCLFLLCLLLCGCVQNIKWKKKKQEWQAERGKKGTWPLQNPSPVWKMDYLGLLNVPCGAPADRMTRLTSPLLASCCYILHGARRPKSLPLLNAHYRPVSVSATEIYWCCPLC